MADAGQGTIQSGQKILRCGYTTGSCAAGAAKAAVLLLLTGRAPDPVLISTPSGKVLHLPVEQAEKKEDSASCAVRKDGGDDIDATNGLLIVALVRKTEGQERVAISGGPGVGRVTKPGLDRPVGDAAINTVPRRMVIKEVEEVLDTLEYRGSVAVTISVPGGEEAAQKTFNERFGITGGISILGTSGIVEPMSEKALTDTIRREILQRKALGEKDLLLAPGNFGLNFLREQYGIPEERAVVCSNYIGDTLDFALTEGFSSCLLVGHIGKLVKLGSGIMNTHSHVADGRLETLAACGIEARAENAALLRVLSCNTTEDAIGCMKQDGIWDAVLSRLLIRIDARLAERVRGKMKTGAVLFSSGQGYLGETKGAKELLLHFRKEMP